MKKTESESNGRLQQCTVRMVGITPLVQHNPAGSMRVADGTAKKRTIPSPEDEAEAAAYRMPDKTLYLKGEAVMGSLRDASAYYKVGKVSARTAIAAGMFIDQEQIPLIDPKSGKPIKDYEIYTCRAVVQKQGILRSRPRLNNWACEVPVNYDQEVLTIEHVAQFFNLAGTYAGVGDQRPSSPMSKGRFGKFEAKILDETKKR